MWAPGSSVGRDRSGVIRAAPDGADRSGPPYVFSQSLKFVLSFSTFGLAATVM